MMVRMVKRVRRAAAALAGSAPVDWLLTRLEHAAGGRDQTLTVLTYHRVAWPDDRPWLYPGLLSATPDDFERDVRWLSRRGAVLSMDDVLIARSRRRLPRRAILVTFDDGYADLADYAWPILRAAGMPATLFVTTAGAEAADATGRPGTVASSPFWWDRLYEAVQGSDAAVADTPAGRVDLKGSRRDPAAFAGLLDRMKGLPHRELLAVVEAICRLAATAPPEDGARPATLDWSALRRLQGEGLTVAPHTRTHPILPMLSAADAEAEVVGSRDDLFARLPGSNVDVFAYPSGRYDAATLAVVDRAGFQLAFSTDRGLNRLGQSDRLRLRRFNVGRRSSPGLLAAQMLVAPAMFRERRSTGTRTF